MNGSAFRRAALAALVVCVAAALAACQSAPKPKPDAGTDERAKVAGLNTQLGIEYMKDGDNELALKKLQKALEIDPHFVDAHNAMGLLRTRLRQFDEAEESFKAALRADPGNSMALNNYGQFLCQQKRYEEGQARFTEAVKNPLYRTPEIALTNAGLCAMQAKDPARAEDHFRAALEKNPMVAPALLQMAQIHYDRGAFADAERYYKRYLAIAPQTPRSLAFGIRLSKALGDADKAASYAIGLRNKFPDSREAGQLQRGELN
ncbi:MAG TPA: type IV pilus biogenesis/stability protein PilW [Gammaproteobacteria bacterium]|nr:type IV pilus biogenesis/stability protein PilW [Gammaproteobacteria bacterium]